PHLFYIDNYMLRNPPIAVQQLKLEVMNMADIAMANFRTSMRMIKTMDFSGKEEFDRNERELDYLNKEIARYLIKLNKLKLDRKDRYYVSSVYKSVTDLERIGDHAQNILEYAEKMKDNNGNFSEIAKNEIGQLEELINELYEKIKEAYRLVDLKMVDEAFDIEQRVDDLTAQMAENHVNRLNDGTCTLEVGAEYLSMTSDAERVADHLINLGKAVRDFAYL
ncbi:MAG: Na/Pi cotransporter family protein, partial [Candidatus Methanomethylophilaceae archaeon]|nr:Na/Pi cotransporter family protein [Candidatus Methanomethylophilaceae archaeon]